MSWGTSYWGTAYWGQGGGYETAATRMLQFNRMGPNFRAFADIVDARYLHISGILDQILNAFDLETAVGEQLDIIGAWLGVQREGMLDSRFRRALKVQRTTILSSTGTGLILRSIVEDWTGTPAIVYSDIPPANVEIAAIVLPEEESLLVQFLEKAKPGGVRLDVHVSSEPPLLIDSSQVSITDPGFIGSSQVVTSGTKSLSHLGYP